MPVAQARQTVRYSFLVPKAIIMYGVVNRMNSAVLCFWVYTATARQTDDRWLIHPQGHSTFMEGKDIHFRYKYAFPPSSPRLGKLFFGRRTPADGPETNLMEADVDPDTGDMTVVYTREINKVNITYYKQGFEITIYNISHSETGLYLTDLNFDLDAALHDNFQLTVFKHPKLRHIQPNTIHKRERSIITLKWQFIQEMGIPRVTHITIIFSKNSQRKLYSTTLISHTMDPETEQWQLIYPDKDQQFVDRISYATDPKHELVELTLCNLRVKDSGVYQLLVGFESNLTRLENQTTLHVMPDYTWINTPRDIEYVINLRNLYLNFTYETNETQPSEHFQLVRMKNDLIGEVILDSKSARSRDNISRWRMISDKTVTLVSAEVTDNGQYNARVKDQSGYILLKKVFNIQVLDGINLMSYVLNTSHLDRRTIEVHFNDSLPSPDRVELLDDENHVTILVQSQTMKTVHFTVMDTVTSTSVRIVFSELDYNITKTLEFSVDTRAPGKSRSTRHIPVILVVVTMHSLAFYIWIIMWCCLHRNINAALRNDDGKPRMP